MNPEAARLFILSARTFLFLLGALILTRLITGRIRMTGLFKDRETGGTSALRVQMLIATLVATASYAASIGRHGATTFPPLDARLLALVGGSNGLLIAKRSFIKLAQFIRTTPQV
jgi:hypothetical protein